MERFAADNLKAERDAHIRAALKADVPWPDIVSDYGIPLEEVMKLAGLLAPGEKRGGAVLWKPDDQKGGAFDG